MFDSTPQYNLNFDAFRLQECFLQLKLQITVMFKKKLAGSNRAKNTKQAHSQITQNAYLFFVVFDIFFLTFKTL